MRGSSRARGREAPGEPLTAESATAMDVGEKEEENEESEEGS